MSIIIGYTINAPRQTDESELVEATLAGQSKACFLDFWHTSRDGQDHVRLHMLASSRLTHDHVRLYVAWLRELGYKARMIIVPTFTIESYSWADDDDDGDDTIQQNALCIELEWTKDDNAMRIFTGLCLMRFISGEFIMYRPEDILKRHVVCVEDLLAVALPRSSYMSSNHFPLRNNFSNSALPRATKVLFAKVVHAFYTDYSINNRWTSQRTYAEQEIPYAPAGGSGISVTSFIEFAKRLEKDMML